MKQISHTKGNKKSTVYVYLVVCVGVCVRVHVHVCACTYQIVRLKLFLAAKQLENICTL